MGIRLRFVCMCCSLLAVAFLGTAGCGGGNQNGRPDPGEDGGCPRAQSLWDDVSLDAFEQLPALEELDFSQVVPAAPTTYWELRFSGLGETRVIGSAGSKCAEAPEPAVCQAAFAALSADTGFAAGCLPLFCYHYVAVNRGAENMVITAGNEFIAFLGTIDNVTEAALAAFAAGYDWTPSDPSIAGVRAVDGGFELLVRDLVSDCLPVRSDRFLLFVSNDGDIEVRRRQAYSVLCNACI